MIERKDDYKIDEMFKETKTIKVYLTVEVEVEVEDTADNNKIEQELNDLSDYELLENIKKINFEGMHYRKDIWK